MSDPMERPAISPRPGAVPTAADRVEGIDPAPQATMSGGSLASTLRSTQGAPGPAGQLLADAPHRTVALLVDMIVVGVLGILVAGSFGEALGGLVSDQTLDSPGGELAVGPFVIVLIIVLVLSLAYFVAGWSRWQATLGMRLLGLAILADDGGHRVPASRGLVRWVFVGIPATLVTVPAFVPSMLAIVLSILGLAALVGLLITIGQDPARQGLHDRYAGSIVTTIGRRRRAAR